MTADNELKPLWSRVTLRDIAEATGVSIGTVSHALSGTGSVASATRERIQACADELGYVRDIMQAHRPSKRSGKAVPLVCLGTQEDQRFCAMDQLAGNARRLGYALDSIQVDADCDVEQLHQQLKERGCQGIIIFLAASEKCPALRSHDWSPFSVVIRGAAVPPAPYCVIHHGIFEQWLMAWRIMIEKGHQRIGAVPFRNNPVHSDDRLREAACLAGQDLLPENAVRIPPCCTPFGDPDAFRQWFETHQPSAIIGFNHLPIRLQPELLADMPYMSAWTFGKHTTRNYTFDRIFFDRHINDLEALYQIDRLIRHRLRGPLEHPFSISCQPYLISGTNPASPGQYE